MTNPYDAPRRAEPPYSPAPGHPQEQLYRQATPVSYRRLQDPYRTRGRGSQLGTALLSLVLVLLLVPIPFIMGSFTQEVVPRHTPTPGPSVAGPRPTSSSTPTVSVKPTWRPTATVTSTPTKTTGTVFASDPDLADPDIRRALSRAIFGPVLAWPEAEVVQQGDVIAITDRDTRDVAELAELSDRALQATDKILPGRWVAPIIVVLPDTSEDFADISGRDGGEYGGVTYTNRDRGAIVLSPEAWDAMGETDRLALLAHEFAHSMTMVGADFSAEQWVTEGFASWVENEVAGEDVRPIERRVLYRQVRRGSGPEDLPNEDYFEEAGGDAYMQSLSIFEFIDDEYGTKSLLDFYTSAGELSTAEAANTALGISKAELRAGWLDWLEQKVRR